MLPFPSKILAEHIELVFTACHLLAKFSLQVFHSSAALPMVVKTFCFQQRYSEAVSEGITRAVVNI